MNPQVVQEQINALNGAATGLEQSLELLTIEHHLAPGIKFSVKCLRDMCKEMEKRYL